MFDFSIGQRILKKMYHSLHKNIKQQKPSLIIIRAIFNHWVTITN